MQHVIINYTAGLVGVQAAEYFTVKKIFDIFLKARGEIAPKARNFNGEIWHGICVKLFICIKYREDVMIDRKRLYENLKKLVKAASVSGTADEVQAAYVIKELLMEIPYFKENPENVMMVPMEGDPFDRVVAAAYLELDPESPDTVILTGHYDVVDLEEFGALKGIACDIEAITERIGELSLSDDARRDLESGNWYFGRGVIDMKFGHALSIELLRHYAEEKGLKGNLLYVAVCGEETNSEGMLAAIPFFTSFAEERGLRYRTLLLTEGYMVDGQEDGVRYIQYGGAGKVMPMFFCAGAMTHGEEPLLGLDANIMAAEVYREMALNPDFCQKNHGITSAPPAGLKLQDMKENYSLSTSLFSAAYFNIATIKVDPEDTMRKLRAVAEKAFDNTIRLMDEKVKGFEAFAERKTAHYEAKPCVMTYGEMYRAVEKTFEGDLSAYMRKKAGEYLSENPELQSACLRLMKDLYELYSDKKPMIVVSVLPPYYPDVNIEEDDEDTRRMLDNIEDLISYAASAHGETVKTSEYYGISDLCYTWLAEGMDFDAIFENLIGMDILYDFPVEELKKFKVPAMVLGSSGKDMHKYTERLEKSYNFDVLPDLFIHLIDRILK